MAEQKRKKLSSAFKLAVVAGLLVFCGAVAVLKMSAGTVKIVAAKEAIPAGAEVTARNTTLVEVPMRVAPADAAKTLEEISGKRVSFPRLPGDFITGSSLTSQSVSQIPPGAVGIFVPLGYGEAQSLKPNDLVAVVACPGSGLESFVAGYFRVAVVIQQASSSDKKAEAFLYGDRDAAVAAAEWIKSGNFRLAVQGG